jgi:NADH-quinone oxidoreductase subunit L
MRRMGGLKGPLPRTFLYFAAGWIALSGVPLTSGFFSKDEILYHAWLYRPVLWFVGAGVAGLTAVYMTRLMGLTFFGASRVDPHAAHHIHEAPPSMSVPLLILAVLSMVGGFVGMPAAWFGDSPFHLWLHPVFSLPEEVASTGHHGPEGALMVVSSVVALAGIGIGYRLWVTRPELPGLIAGRLAGLARLVRGKFFVDEIYDAAIVQPYHALCRVLARFDTVAVDGAVNGVGAVMETSGQVLKLFHSGFVRNYALFYLAGAAAVLWYLVR